MATESTAPARRYVVGLDTSPESTVALRWAVRRALTRHAELDLAHTWSLPTVVGPPELAGLALPDRETLDRSAFEVISEQVHEVVPEGADEVPFVVHVREGSASSLLLELADADHADLIVLGSRGHAGPLGALLGSVGRQVGHHTSVPTVLVHGDGSASGDVVVGVDGSPGSLAALEWAVQEAVAAGVSLYVIGSWTYPTMPAIAFGNALPPASAMDDSTMQMLHWALEQVEIPSDLTVNTLVLEGGAAHVLIQESAKAGLLVVGARGAGGFRGLRLGSVADRCAGHAKVPVVLVPPPLED